MHFQPCQEGIWRRNFEEGQILTVSQKIGGQSIITLIIKRCISINITIPSLVHSDIVVIPSTIVGLHLIPSLPLQSIYMNMMMLLIVSMCE
jgi:hypothetical protein